MIPAICRAWLFALPGSELEEGPPGGSQGGASPGRAVPASGLHRYQLEFAESVGGTVYKKRGTAEQWIKEGKQAAREGKLSRRRNNRSGVQALGRESQNGNSGQEPPLDCIVLRLSQFRCGLLGRRGSLGNFQLSSYGH